MEDFLMSSSAFEKLFARAAEEKHSAKIADKMLKNNLMVRGHSLRGEKDDISKFF